MRYLKSRILERSTIAAIIAGVAAAAMIPEPYSWLCIGLSVFQALLPDGPVKKEAEE